jgi:hypothetical protein
MGDTPSIAARDKAAVQADETKIEETPGEGTGNPDGNPSSSANGESKAGDADVVPETPDPLAKINTDADAEEVAEETEQVAEEDVNKVAGVAEEGTAEAVAGAAETVAVDGLESGLEGAG